jgi:hypothetical protein
MSRKCDKLHADYDRLANAGVQIGELPDWMHVRGAMCWHVYEGPYDGLGKGWERFMRKAQEAHRERLASPPGDVYVCDPEDHKAEKQGDMITILWCPVK